MKSYPVNKLPPTKYMGNVVFQVPKAIECCNSIASSSAPMKGNVDHNAADGAKPRRGRHAITSLVRRRRGATGR